MLKAIQLSEERLQLIEKNGFVWVIMNTRTKNIGEIGILDMEGNQKGIVDLDIISPLTEMVYLENRKHFSEFPDYKELIKEYKNPYMWQLKNYKEQIISNGKVTKKTAIWYTIEEILDEVVEREEETDEVAENYFKKCYCGGVLEKESYTAVYPHLTIRNIPALVCSQCKQPYFVQKNQNKLKRLLQANQGTKDIDFMVYGRD